MMNCDNTGDPELYQGGYVAEVQLVYHDEGEVIRRYFRRDKLIQERYRLRALAQKNLHSTNAIERRMASIEKELFLIERKAKDEPDLGVDRAISLNRSANCPMTAFVVFHIMK